MRRSIVSFWLTVFLAFAIQFEFGVAHALEPRKTIGCTVRSDGLPYNIFPDTVPNISIKRNFVFASRDVSKDATMPTIDSLLKAGDGFIVYCQCKTVSSAPISVLTAVEYVAEGDKYYPTFAFTRTDLLSDLSGKLTSTVVKIEIKRNYTGDFSIERKDAKKSPSSGVLRGQGRLERKTANTSDFKDSKAEEGRDVSFYLTWASVGSTPSSAETRVWGEILCK